MKSLGGRKVMVTRAIDDCAPLIERLRSAGAETVAFPCIMVQYIDDHRTVERLRSELAVADWLAFTSRRGVRAIASAAERVPDHVKIAAVGRATEAEARELLGRCDLVGSEGTGRSLGRDLRATVDSDAANAGTIVVASAAHGRHDLEKELQGSPCRVLRIEVYRTTPVPDDGPPTDLADGVDTIILASPSAVTGLINQAVVPSSIRIVTIGPTTSQAVIEAGLTVAAEAVEPSIEALIKVV